LSVIVVGSPEIALSVAVMVVGVVPVVGSRTGFGDAVSVYVGGRSFSVVLPTLTVELTPLTLIKLKVSGAVPSYSVSGAV